MTDKIRLVCAHCQTINQFSAERLTDNPNCAKCKNSLLSESPIEVNNEQLSRHIKNSGLPVLVDFWAPWCGPCLQFAPIFSQYAAQSKQKIRVLKIDTEANQQAGAIYNIRSIPTLAIFRNGKEINRMSGGLALNHLDQWVMQQLATS